RVFGVDDRAIREFGRDGLQVKCGRAVTTFAADATIVRRRPGLREDGRRASRMAEQTLVDAIGGIELFAKEVAAATGVGGVAGGANPTGITTGAIVRKPQNVGPSLVVRADQ